MVAQNVEHKNRNNVKLGITITDRLQNCGPKQNMNDTQVSRSA